MCFIPTSNIYKMFTDFQKAVLCIFKDWKTNKQSEKRFCLVLWSDNGKAGSRSLIGQSAINSHAYYSMSRL